MAEVVEPQCSMRACRHLKSTVPANTGETASDLLYFCDAFPTGIPRDILYGGNVHLGIDPRQQGTTVYEPD